MKLLTMEDIVSSTDKLEWVIHGLIPKQGLALITGHPGVGKTWMGLIMAKRITEAIPFLSMDTNGTSVVYIDLESPKPIFRDRLLRVKPTNVLFLSTWDLTKPFSLWDPELEELCRAKHVLIIDSFVRAHDADENSTMEMARVMSRLRYLTHQGATIVIIHHKGKSGESGYRGSSDILAGVDVAYSLENKTGDGKYLELTTLKSRVSFPLYVSCVLDIGPAHATILVSGGHEPDHDVVVALLKEAIFKLGEPCQADIVQELKGKVPFHIVRSVLGKGTGIHWEVRSGSSYKRIFSLRVEKQ